MAWSTPRVWTVGELLTASNMNTYVSDELTALDAASRTKPSFIVRQTVAQAFLNSTTTVVTFDVEDEDTHSGHSLVSNTSRYTIPIAGVWFFSGSIAYATNAAGTRGVKFLKNAAGVGGRHYMMAAPNGGSDVSTSRHLRAAVNDFIEVAGIQTSGGTLNTSVVAGDSESVFTGSWQRI